MNTESGAKARYFGIYREHSLCAARVVLTNHVWVVFSCTQVSSLCGEQRRWNGWNAISHPIRHQVQGRGSPGPDIHYPDVPRLHWQPRNKLAVIADGFQERRHPNLIRGLKHRRKGIILFGLRGQNFPVFTQWPSEHCVTNCDCVI